MNEPDGLEERTADLEEHGEREYERIDAIEDLADSQTDEALLATSRDVLDATRDSRDTIARLIRENEALWKAGHDAGYAEGYRAATAHSRKIVEAIFPMVKR